MVDISRHPLIKQAYDVCQAIEAIKDGDHFVASESQTAACSAASALMDAIDKFIPGNAESRIPEIGGIAGKWGFSRDEDSYSGAYNTREEAIQEAESCGYGRCWVGQFEAPVLEEAIDADDLLEKVLCQDDYCGDWAEDALDCTNEQKDELTEEVRRVFREWMDKHGLRPTFGIVRQAEEITCEGPSS